MHEMALTQDLIEVITERCVGRKVRKVFIVMGPDTCVMRDAFRFCFDACAEGTVLEGAELIFEDAVGDALRLRAVEVI
jgi:hydrogenase nickel incorporation protein HypA/HybF